MEILFLLIVLVVLFLAVFSSRKEQASAADNIKDAVQKEKQGFAEEDIMTYRNRSFSSPVTGTVAPLHHTPWGEAMDDSMTTFMKSK